MSEKRCYTVQTFLIVGSPDYFFNTLFCDHLDGVVFAFKWIFNYIGSQFSTSI